LFVPVVFSVGLSDGDNSFVVLDAHWGGLLTDDGESFFLVTQSGVGFLFSSEGTGFYTLPPFLSSEDRSDNFEGGSVPSSVPDENIFDAELGVFVTQARSEFPDVYCNLRLENYRHTDMILGYRWWISDNLLADYDDTRGGLVEDVVIDGDRFYSQSHDLEVVTEGDYYCKFEILRKSGERIVGVAQKVKIVNVDWSVYVLYGLAGVVFLVILVWTFIALRKSRRKTSS
jgi:hypothetical protein